MAIPVLKDYTMRRGNRTKAGNAVVKLSKLMQTGGDTATLWTITQTGGTVGHWAITTDGNCPTPSTTGDNAELNGGPYTFDVVATNASGDSLSKTLTINIATDVYTVAKPADIDTSIRNGLDNGVSIKNNLGGRTIEFATACDEFFSSFAAGNFALFRGFNTHTGTFDVTSEDQNNPPKLSRIYCNGGVVRARFHHLKLSYFVAAHGPDIGLPPDGGNSQGGFMFQISYNSTFGTCSDITFEDSDLGPTEAEAPYVSQWTSAIALAGQSSGARIPLTNIILRNLNINRSKDALNTANVVGCTFEHLNIDRFCSNSMFNGGVSGNIWRDIVIVRPMINRADVGDHRDFAQFGANAPFTNYDSYIIEDVYLIMANGDSGSQGVFFDDVGVYSSVVTGYSQNNHSISRIFYDGADRKGVHMDVGENWDVRFCTTIRGACVNMKQLDVNGNYAPPTYAYPWMDGNDLAPTKGFATHNAIQSIANDIPEAYFPGITTLNKHLNTIHAAPAGWSNISYNNEAERTAYYSQFFQDPGRVVDYESLSARQILNQIKEMYSPIQGGPLMFADGTYAGCFFPDGTTNDGSVYLATPPTSYSITGNNSVQVGSVLPLTITLDAIANADYSFTFGVSGATGTFDPTTLVIPTGESSGVVNFTATSAGTATITPDSTVLTDPASFIVTVTSPAVVPTEITQSSNKSIIGINQGVTLTYELDAPATENVIITPNCSLAGIFSSSTVTILVGQISAGVTFTPSETGIAEFTLTNDKGLDNPSSLFVTVAASKTTNANLIKLGMR